MKLAAQTYVEDLRKPEHKNVIFRYPRLGDRVILSIDDFKSQYGHREVTINGDFIDENGNLMEDAFIKMMSK